MSDMDDLPDEPPERDEDEPRRRRSRGCRCGGDMPGRCPGPENCPMCQDDDDDELEAAERARVAERVTP